MSYLSVVPEILQSVSGRLETMGTGLRTANAAAAAQTTAIAAPAVDEISLAISTVLGEHGRQFQALSAQSAAYHDSFVRLLNGGAAQYLSAEIANVQQTLASAGAVGTAAASPLDTLNSLTTVAQSSSFGPLQLTSSFGLSGLYQSAVLNGPFGPVGSLTLSGIPYFPTSAGEPLGLVASATGTLNTAFGPVTFMSANGSMLISSTGGFTGSLGGLTPLGPTAVMVNGTIPTITGGSITALGMQFWFQGNQFGVVPLFLRPLGLL